jgi:hypothetical protein
MLMYAETWENSTQIVLSYLQKKSLLSNLQSHSQLTSWQSLELRWWFWSFTSQLCSGHPLYSIRGHRADHFTVGWLKKIIFSLQCILPIKLSVWLSLWLVRFGQNSVAAVLNIKWVRVANSLNVLLMNILTCKINLFVKQCYKKPNWIVYLRFHFGNTANQVIKGCQFNLCDIFL